MLKLTLTEIAVALGANLAPAASAACAGSTRNYDRWSTAPIAPMVRRWARCRFEARSAPRSHPSAGGARQLASLPQPD